MLPSYYSLFTIHIRIWTLANAPFFCLFRINFLDSNVWTFDQIFYIMPNSASVKHAQGKNAVKGPLTLCINGSFQTPQLMIKLIRVTKIT
jgi:hypothetical protein